MYLFTRSARLAPGRTRQALHWAEAITEKVNQISELEMSLWTRVLSPGVGTLSWAAQTDRLQALDDTNSKLMVDDGYLDLLDEGAAFVVGGANDSLFSIVRHSTRSEARPAFAGVTIARIRPGKAREAMQLGIHIAERAEEISGLPTTFAVANTGDYGGVQWLTTYDSMEQMQQVGVQMAAHEAFRELLDAKASVTFEGARQRVAQRIM